MISREIVSASMERIPNNFRTSLGTGFHAASVYWVMGVEKRY